MRFRVTSITGTEEGPSVAAITTELEDALNAELSSMSFGSNLDQFTVVFVTAFDELRECERWASGQSKLGSVTNKFTGERFRQMSLGVPLRREAVFGRPLQETSKYIRKMLGIALSSRPKRVAKGLDYPALSSSIQQVACGQDKSAA